MHLFKLDSIIYKIYKNKWKLEEDGNSIPTYIPPKLWKLKFQENSENELILYQYPSHYRHMSLFQYDTGFFFYFSFISTSFLFLGLNNLRKKNYKSFGIFSIMSAITLLEGQFISKRVKDAKYISLINGRELSIKTFQDGEIEYRMDIKDLRVVNKDTTNLIILIDVNMARNKNFQFFFIEPTQATIYNQDLISTIILDKRYLQFDNHKLN